VKLVLFDVDGTLLSASGAGRRALDQAMRDVYGTAGPIDGYDFRGGTDPQIIRDLLGRAGLDEAAIAAGETESIGCYEAHARRRESGDGRGVTVYQGCARVVEALAARRRVRGRAAHREHRAGARISCAHGLWPRFRLGASGRTTRIGPAAHGCRGRAKRLVGRAFLWGRDTVIIGDTPRDIGCHEHTGEWRGSRWRRLAQSLATLTPRPDHAFATFSDLTLALAANARPLAPRLADRRRVASRRRRRGLGGRTTYAGHLRRTAASRGAREALPLLQRGRVVSWAAVRS
jgi:phosphoglycolate phosphatase-like HAD superfamily hydrolase